MEEAAAAEYLEGDHFIHNAYFIIHEMDKLCQRHYQDAINTLMDEVLHSIFFLGQINDPPYSPEDILATPEIVNKWRKRYPRPFQFYTCQLPRRSPFSCLLDMVVHVIGQQNENEIINKLKDIYEKLRGEKLRGKKLRGKKLGGKKLASSTICVSQKNTAEDSVRYYGVSMSTSDRDPGRIIVAASCLKYWDDYVADAVMTYYPVKIKKTYFDGTIKLPEQVRCQAFSLRDGAKMDPCRSCANMFGLMRNGEDDWVYGNCAEAESVSNLLRIDKEVREKVKQPSETCTPENRQKAKGSVYTELGLRLGAVNYQWTYIPQL